MRFWRKPDPFLSRTVKTERFDLVPCGVTDAFNISWRWTRDREILENLTFDTTPRNKVQWFRELEKPNNYNNFTHAIIPRGKRNVIGLHRISINVYKTATIAIAIHDRAWWGKGVFAEVRGSLMSHFFHSDRIVRFQAIVNARNFSSVFNYKKLGYRHAGTLKNARLDPATGTFFDVLLFEMLRESWPEIPEPRQ